MSTLKDLLEQRNELELKLKMHEASMGSASSLARKRKEQQKKVDTPSKPNQTLKYELTPEALQMAEKIMATKGVETMAQSSIVGNVFKPNPIRTQKPEEQSTEQKPEDNQSSVKPEKKQKKLKSKDPLHSTAAPGKVQAVKVGDTLTNVDSKLFSFIKMEYKFESRKSKRDKKYRKEIDDQKERHFEELVEAFSGKKPSVVRKMGRAVKKSGLVKYGLIAAGALGGLMVSRNALANIDWKNVFQEGLGGFDIPGLGSQKTFGEASSLKDLISSGESGAAGYNSYNTGEAGKSGAPMNLTEMSVDDVMKLQKEGKIFAAGKYQIIPETLKGGVKELGLTGKEKFNQETQDKLFSKYLIGSKRPEIQEYLNSPNPSPELKRKAQIGLSQEFASIAHPDTGKSFYEGKGGNKASITSEQALAALEKDRLKNQEGKSESVGKINSPYGSRIHPITGKPDFHTGVDVKGKLGDAVESKADGVVTIKGEKGKYGKYIEVDHGNGMKTRYAHLSNQNVEVGDKVKMGQKIGEVGQTGSATGPHLHYEVFKDGQLVNPEEYSDIQSAKLKQLPPTEQKQVSEQLGPLPKKSSASDGTKLSVLKSQTNIINGGTTYQVAQQDTQTHSVLIDKQYFNYG